MKKFLSLTCIVILFLSLFAFVTFAHSGKTDSNGGHYNRSTGEYHYHHGYPAHQHYDMDGDGDRDCPYNFDDKTNHYGGANNSHSTTIDKVKPTKEISTEDIVKAVVAIILVSVAVLFVGLCFSWFTIIQKLVMIPIEALIRRYCKEESQDIIVGRCETAVLVVISIASVIIISVSILSSKEII